MVANRTSVPDHRFMTLPLYQLALTFIRYRFTIYSVPAIFHHDIYRHNYPKFFKNSFHITCQKLCIVSMIDNVKLVCIYYFIVKPNMSYVELVDHSNYEILNEYPFTIRRKDNHYEVSESLRCGYPRIKLNGKDYNKHILIAKLFIPNDDPEHKTQVDHINHDRTDYHIDHLRWVTPSQNQLNKTGRRDIKYEYFDDIPDESTVVDFYETRNDIKYFDESRYYYYYDDETDEDLFYGRVKDDLYRKLHINVNKSGSQFIRCIDINGEYVSLYINRFKQQHDLI